jgi:hypothetical protein
VEWPAPHQHLYTCPINTRLLYQPVFLLYTLQSSVQNGKKIKYNIKFLK